MSAQKVTILTSRLGNRNLGDPCSSGVLIGSIIPAEACVLSMWCAESDIWPQDLGRSAWRRYGVVIVSANNGSECRVSGDLMANGSVVVSASNGTAPAVGPARYCSGTGSVMEDMRSCGSVVVGGGVDCPGVGWDISDPLSTAHYQGIRVGPSHDATVDTVVIGDYASRAIHQYGTDGGGSDDQVAQPPTIIVGSIGPSSNPGRPTDPTTGVDMSTRLYLDKAVQIGVMCFSSVVDPTDSSPMMPEACAIPGSILIGGSNERPLEVRYIVCAAPLVFQFGRYRAAVYNACVFATAINDWACANGHCFRAAYKQLTGYEHSPSV